MREPEPLQQIDRTYVRYKNRKLSYFAGCDYFRISSHPAVQRALLAGLKQYGLNVAASRLTTGNHTLYAKLEKTLAAFFTSPAALLVSNGYATNAIVAQALRGKFLRVLIDEKAHVSLQDASRHFDCPVVRFKHCDRDDLARKLARAAKSPIVLTDGMFSNDGSIAPLDEYAKILPRNSMILVDDAHGAGVLGRTGKGTLEQTGVSRARIIQTVTLSKAFGVYGGAILCDKPLRDAIISKSGMFAGSTPLPLPLANAANTAVQILQRDQSLRHRLQQNVQYAKSALREVHRSIPATHSPIIALTPKSAAEAAALCKRLLACKVFPSFIQYPGGPPNGYFRFVISSEHTSAQLDALLRAFRAS